MPGRFFTGYHDAAFALIVDQDERVLWKKRNDIDIWDLPGGGADPSDYQHGIWQPTYTVRREISEETGCEVKLHGIFGLFFTAALIYDEPSLTCVFLAEIQKGELCLNDEAQGFGWFHYEELPKNAFLIQADVQRQFERGKVDRHDLRYLVQIQRRVLGIA